MKIWEFIIVLKLIKIFVVEQNSGKFKYLQSHIKSLLSKKLLIG